MATTDRPGEPPAGPDDLARRCREADFVRLLGTADGDGVAATALLAQAMDAVDVPYQASVHRGPVDAGSTAADLTVGVGLDRGDVSLRHCPLSGRAVETARALGGDPDPVLALAGSLAAGVKPAETPATTWALEAAADRLDRRPGIALPTADISVGLAHTTLVHADFSGDVDAARTVVADLDLGRSPSGADRRRLASLVALSAVDGAPPRAASAIDRAIHPYATEGTLETLGGFADVLEATALERPGTALAFALGHGDRSAALEAWREHGLKAHRAVHDVDLTATGDVAVARIDAGPVRTVARLLVAFRSPAPVAVVVRGSRAAVATADRDVAPIVAAAAGAAGGTGIARGPIGEAGDVDPDGFVDAVREEA